MTYIRPVRDVVGHVSLGQVLAYLLASGTAKNAGDGQLGPEDAYCNESDPKQDSSYVRMIRHDTASPGCTAYLRRSHG
jgi:hypothetical protein